jgi:branched-chain amino acid aminotransferase
VRDGVARTPPGDAGCLLGVTRALLLELDADVIEATLTLDDLRTADEAFLSSTVREVQPIATVDGHALPAAPGPVTEKLAAAFTDLVGRDLDP